MVEGVESGHSEMASVIVGSWRVSASRVYAFYLMLTNGQRRSFIVYAKRSSFDAVQSDSVHEHVFLTTLPSQLNNSQTQPSKGERAESFCEKVLLWSTLKWT